MEHFFLPEIQDTFTVEGDTYRHLTRSRRMRLGERAVFCDGSGMDYLAKMTACTKDTATFEVLECTPSVTECPLKISLFQCLPKGDKMEEVLHRCTPLGISRFIPVKSERSAEAPGENKRKRWEKIILSAATQCGRSILPELSSVLSFQEAIEEMKKADLALICYENSEEPLPPLPQEGTLAVLIGPEGGLTPQEAESLPTCTLGRRILRTEEAAAFLMPILLDRSGNL